VNVYLDYESQLNLLLLFQYVQIRSLWEEVIEFPLRLVNGIEDQTPKAASRLRSFATFPLFVAKAVNEDIKAAAQATGCGDLQEQLGNSLVIQFEDDDIDRDSEASYSDQHERSGWFEDEGTDEASEGSGSDQHEHSGWFTIPNIVEIVDPSQGEVENDVKKDESHEPQQQATSEIVEPKTGQNDEKDIAVEKEETAESHEGESSESPAQEK